MFITSYCCIGRVVIYNENIWLVHIPYELMNYVKIKSLDAKNHYINNLLLQSMIIYPVDVDRSVNKIA